MPGGRLDPSDTNRDSEPQREAEALAQRVTELEARVAFLEQTLKETLEELQRILIGNLAYV